MTCVHVYTEYTHTHTHKVRFTTVKPFGVETEHFITCKSRSVRFYFNVAHSFVIVFVSDFLFRFRLFFCSFFLCVSCWHPTKSNLVISKSRQKTFLAKTPFNQDLYHCSIIIIIKVSARIDRYIVCNLYYVFNHRLKQKYFKISITRLWKISHVFHVQQISKRVFDDFFFSIQCWFIFNYTNDNSKIFKTHRGKKYFILTVGAFNKWIGSSPASSDWWRVKNKRLL